MKKIVLFPLEIHIITPWDSLPGSLVNAFIHISASGTCRNCLYSCNIPVMRLINVLASKWMHDSCYMRICVARAYLEAVLSVLGCWKRKDYRSAVGYVIVTLGDGAVMGLGDGTLGDVMLGPGDGNNQ